MTPKDLLSIVDPALALLNTLAGIKVSNEARVLVMAIAGQESDWEARLQGGGGPARSFWQFEGGGGAVGELFSVTPKQLKAVCDYLIVPYNVATVFQAMAWNDTLAACMARLLLWQDPAALPAIGDVQAGWNYYQRNWRPGAPRPEVWPAKYA
ncbi:MAG: hypothetical protein JWM19_4402, partial [Actinomycetia bacterium]|nr:hypothetical protein [Actinomycetes bacterium]